MNRLCFCQTLGFMLMFGIVTGSRLTLTALPPVVSPPLTPAIRLKCALVDTAQGGSIVGRSISDYNDIENDSPPENNLRRDASSTQSNAKFVISMVLQRDGKDVASLSEHVPARSLVSEQNLNVSGGIPGGQGEKGVLEVDIKYPTASQAGSYCCLATAIDDVGHSISFSTSANVTVVNSSPSVTDLLHIIQAQNQKSEDIVSGLKSDIADLKSQATALNQKNTDQETVINGNKAKIASLETALQESSHVEGGTINCGVIGSGAAKQTRNAYFKKHYTSPPLVHVSILDIGVYKTYDAKFKVNVTKSDLRGFTVECTIESDADFVQHLMLSWLSFPQA